MNLPNTLSAFRLFVTIFFIISVNAGNFRFALFLFVLQAVSDLLDGFFARIMGVKTQIGALLDPLADKVMLTSSYIVLSMKGFVPLWVTLVLISRDMVIGGGFLILYRLSKRIRPIPSLISKVTTLAQMCTVVYILWTLRGCYATYFFYITAVLTIISGIHYVTRGIGILTGKKSFDNL